MPAGYGHIRYAAGSGPIRRRLQTLVAALLLIVACSSSSSNPQIDNPIFREVQAELAALLGVSSEDLDPDAKFSVLEPRPDELDAVELIMILEERFDVEISDQAIAKYTGSAVLETIAANLSIRSLAAIVHDLKD